MIEHRADTSVLLTDDNDPTRQQLIPAGATDEEISDAAIAFFAASETGREE